MKTLYRQAMFFIKSGLWSLLFYFVLMLIINWDDVASKINGKDAVTTVIPQSHTPQSEDSCPGDSIPVKISAGSDAISAIRSFFYITRSL